MQNKLNMVDSFEKIEVKIYPTAVEGSVYAAQQIADLIKQKASKGEMLVLGMATGSTPLQLITVALGANPPSKIASRGRVEL